MNIRKICFIFACFIICSCGSTVNLTDSEKKELAETYKQEVENYLKETWKPDYIENALKSAEKLISLDEKSYEGYLERGKIYIKSAKEHSDSGLMYGRYLQTGNSNFLDKNENESKSNKARKNAIRDLKKSRNLKETPENLYFLAKAYSLSECKDSTLIELYDRALELEPNKELMSKIYNDYGDIYKKNKDYLQALNFYTDATTVCPPECNSILAESYYNIAKTFYEVGQLDLALKNFNKAEAVDEHLFMPEKTKLEKEIKQNAAIEAEKLARENARNLYKDKMRLPFKTFYNAILLGKQQSYIPFKEGDVFEIPAKYLTVKGRTIENGHYVYLLSTMGYNPLSKCFYLISDEEIHSIPYGNMVTDFMIIEYQGESSYQENNWDVSCSIFIKRYLAPTNIFAPF